MTAERVRELLKRYNTNRGRAGHLNAEIAELDIEYARTRRELLITAASPGAQVISDMPRASGGVSDKVGELAARMADGWEPDELKEIALKRQRLADELQVVEVELKYVEAWLDALPDRERLIVAKQMIDGCTWRECADDYARVYGIEYSREGLRRVRRDALRLIYQIACK